MGVGIQSRDTAQTLRRSSATTPTPISSTTPTSTITPSSTATTPSSTTTSSDYTTTAIIPSDAISTTTLSSALSSGLTTVRGVIATEPPLMRGVAAMVEVGVGVPVSGHGHRRATPSRQEVVSAAVAA